MPSFELSKQVLGNLIGQQRKAELMQQTPEYQAAVDQLFANRIQFAQNQAILSKIEKAETEGELIDAIKTVNPELRIKYAKEQVVGGQILDLLAGAPEGERDYGLINYLASTLGYGDVGPIEARPLSPKRYAQELALRRSVYLGPQSQMLRRQREEEYKDMLDRGILHQGKPATEDERMRLQTHYLKYGVIPKEFEILEEPLKPPTEKRPTEAMMQRWWGQALDIVKQERAKFTEAGLKKREAIFWIDEEATFKNMLTMTDEEFAKFVKDQKLDPRLIQFRNLFTKYGIPSLYSEAAPGEYLTPTTTVDQNNPIGFEFE